LEDNDQLSEIAQRWAEQMARTGKLEHSPPEWRGFGLKHLKKIIPHHFKLN
jgi:uncharacterized protein YkwD